MAALQQIEASLVDVLSKAKSEDLNVRRSAEATVKEWENQNFALYLAGLALFCNNPARDINSRFLAGVLFRQTLTAKDNEEREAKASRWLQSVPEDVKNSCKELFLRTMLDNDQTARQIAAQVVARIALVELPAKQWGGLIKMLLDTMTNAAAPAGVKQATLDTLGYICEEIDPEVLTESADQILTAVVQGMRPEETNVMVKRSACKALFNALDFCRKNFENPQERDFIMDVVIRACTFDDEEIPIAAYGILNAVAEQHYDQLASSMQRIFKVTMDHIRAATADIEDQHQAKLAVEFWSTIADEELSLIDEANYCQQMGLAAPARKPLFFIKGVAQFLAPVLTDALTKQDDEDVDPEDWNLPMAAGACIGLIAQTIGDEIIPHVINFIERNIQSQQWNFKEAAILTFGSVLEGPKNIQQFVTQAAPVVLAAMQDSHVAVQDTAAWTLGRVAKFHHKCIVNGAENFLGLMAQALAGKPRVAANAAWFIHNFAAAFEGEENNPMMKYYINVVGALLSAADRGDADQYHLRSAAYESLNVVLATCPDSAMKELEQISKTILDKLDRSFSIQVVNQDDVNRMNELQGLLCGALQIIVQKVGPGIGVFADGIMVQVLRIFNSKRNSAVHEEAFLTVAAIANAVEKDFNKYMNDFHNHLYNGLANWRDYQVCSVAVGVVGDVARALGSNIAPYCDRIITLLLQNLQNRNLDRAVKPPILSCFGDIALAIGGGFDKYLEVVMNMLRQAAQSVMKSEFQTSDDYDLIEYMNSLREGILEAYTGIIQGLKADKKAGLIFPHINPIMMLIAHVHADAHRSDGCARTAVGIIADLILSLNTRVRQAVTQQFVQQLVQDTYRRAECDETRQTAEFTGELLKKL